jgi:DNA gyrase/topoisomerase IV subunit B
MNVKITKRNVKPSATQMSAYKLNKTVQRAHVPNLRFGKVAFATDADVDG